MCYGHLAVLTQIYATLYSTTLSVAPIKDITSSVSRGNQAVKRRGFFHSAQKDDWDLGIWTTEDNYVAMLLGRTLINMTTH
ncbi:hypothetical protein RRG08_033258 [Elysia crispata]|uniref:Uncharacterized protein n=1 Tax=Elysia crispata TaxID=231223 RepID=A0AAE1CKY8_9GAST|nr:hypothetical protein RRG08_033258 [Elysia crispata]